MLIGSYQHNIDEKGRVIMPSKFREELGKVFYATKGTDSSIMVLSKNDWEELGQKIRSLPSAKTKDIQRFLFSSAAELVPDKQGRVLIPQVLRKYAKLEKDVVIIGTGSKVEIWNAERWDKYNEDISESQVLEVMNLFEL